MRHLAPAIAALGLLLLAGCASTDKQNGLVAIATAENGILFEGTHCTVKTDTQSWDVVTPATLEIGPANGELRIACTKEGYVVSEVRVQPGPSGTGGSGPSVGLGLGGSSGGIGSMIGAGLGLTLPFGSRTDNAPYPPYITVNMTRQSQDTPSAAGN